MTQNPGKLVQNVDVQRRVIRREGITIDERVLSLSAARRFFSAFGKSSGADRRMSDIA